MRRRPGGARVPEHGDAIERWIRAEPLTGPGDRVDNTARSRTWVYSSFVALGGLEFSRRYQAVAEPHGPWRCGNGCH